MLYITRNKWVNAVYTASENIDTGPMYFNLTLKNLFTGESVGPMTLTNVSPSTERYDLSVIGAPVLKQEWQIDSDYTIEEDEIVLVRGDVTVSTDKTLTILGTLMIIDGTVIGEKDDSEGFLYENLPISIITNHFYNLTDQNKLVFVELLPGYYDYTISDVFSSETLEIGRLLIDSIRTTENSYTPTQDVYVYNPNI